jgi:hypothetical protein
MHVFAELIKGFPQFAIFLHPEDNSHPSLSAECLFTAIALMKTTGASALV